MKCDHPMERWREVSRDTVRCGRCGMEFKKPRCRGKPCHFVPVHSPMAAGYGDELNPNPVRVEAYCDACGRPW